MIKPEQLIDHSSEISRDLGIKLNNAIAYRRIGYTYVLILTDIGQMVFLNHTAGHIIELFDKGMPNSLIPDEICRIYCLDKATAYLHYSNICTLFIDLGILIVDNYSQIPSRHISGLSKLNSDPRDRIKLYCSEEGIPIQAFIEITPDCNLSCTHCYFPFTDISEDRLNSKEIHNLLDQLYHLGCLEVIFTG